MARQADDDQHTADQYEFHMDAIGSVIARWRAGDISAAGKRQQIAEENARYYGPGRRSPVNGELLTAARSGAADLVPTLADAAGIPAGAMASALRARRHASATARSMLDHGKDQAAAAAVEAEGVQAYADIIASALPPRRTP